MAEQLSRYVRAVLQLAVWIIPIPFGAFASDNGFLASLGMIVFWLASLSLPVTIRRRQIKRHRSSAYAPTGSALYGGLVVWFVAVGVLNGCMSMAWWQEYVPRLLLLFLWMLGTVAVQFAAAQGIAAWQARLRKYWYSEFLDPLLYSLPLPCAVMGMLLFPKVADGEVTPSLVIGVMGIMGFGFIAMGICVIATFAFYFFPSKTKITAAKERLLQVVRIVVMTVVWLAGNHLIFDSRLQIFSSFVFQFMPVVQNNFLVFITPFILEGFLVVASIAVANVIVMGIRKIT